MTGRWPANVILTPVMAEALDGQSGTSKSKSASRGNLADMRGGSYASASGRRIEGSDTIRGHDDEGGASRFFLTAGYEPWELEWITANGLRAVGE